MRIVDRRSDQGHFSACMSCRPRFSIRSTMVLIALFPVTSLRLSRKAVRSSESVAGASVAAMAQTFSPRRRHWHVLVGASARTFGGTSSVTSPGSIHQFKASLL